MKIKHNSDYRAQRADAYLPLAEQIDLWFKDPELLREHIQSVKDLYPKPPAKTGPR